MLEILLVFPQSEVYRLEHPPGLFPYGRIQIADWAGHGIVEALAKVVNMECLFLKGELAREYPDMEFHRVRVTGHHWVLDNVNDSEVEQPLTSQDYATLAAVEHFFTT